MSDMEAITKLESLPNEILLDCFEYFNAVDIVNAFGCLNSRFDNLIRDIQLYLNVDEAEPDTLAEFGRRMLLNPQIKTQIISIKLSEKNASDKVKHLFSFTPLNEFSNLQSLILSYMDWKVSMEIPSMLPSLTNLRYFSLEEPFWGKNEILAALPTSTIRTLSVKKLDYTPPLTNQFTSLVNLIVSYCTVDESIAFFKHCPSLYYLDIKRLRGTTDDTVIYDPQLSLNQAVHLKRLIIANVHASFSEFEILVKQTPNLKFLMISAENELEKVNADRWRKLINTSLPLLDIFKFTFSFDIRDEDPVPVLINNFQQFQTQFWYQQHHWYIEYVLRKDRAIVYTVPYILDAYEITPDTKRYFDIPFNTRTIFARVTDLTWNTDATINSDEYCFPNVKFLKLRNTRNDDNQYLDIKQIESLKKMVDLNNLLNLEIESKYRWKSPFITLQLLKEAPNLSLLTVNGTIKLFKMSQNRDLYEYLTKAIKKLDIGTSYDDEDLNLNESGKICQIFSNMGKFRCNAEWQDKLKVIVNRLSEPNHIKVFSYEAGHVNTIIWWLNCRISNLEVYSFIIKCESNI